MILVIGATGNVGSKLVEQLATMGHFARDYAPTFSLT